MIDFAHMIDILPDMLQAFWETLYMIGISFGVALIIGLPLGVILFTTDRGLFLQNRPINASLGFIVNMIRSIPFIILIVARSEERRVGKVCCCRCVCYRY